MESQLWDFRRLDKWWNTFALISAAEASILTPEKKKERGTKEHHKRREEERREEKNEKGKEKAEKTETGNQGFSHDAIQDGPTTI